MSLSTCFEYPRKLEWNDRMTKSLLSRLASEGLPVKSIRHPGMWDNIFEIHFLSLEGGKREPLIVSNPTIFDVKKDFDAWIDMIIRSYKTKAPSSP